MNTKIIRPIDQFDGIIYLENIQYKSEFCIRKQNIKNER